MQLVGGLPQTLRTFRGDTALPLAVAQKLQERARISAVKRVACEQRLVAQTQNTAVSAKQRSAELARAQREVLQQRIEIRERTDQEKRTATTIAGVIFERNPGKNRDERLREQSRLTAELHEFKIEQMVNRGWRRS